MRRIPRDVLDIPKNHPKTYSIWPANGNDFSELIASIVGPDNTPYQGGIFFLKIQLPSEYPLKKPNLVFMTKIYHPNVHSSGKIRLGIINNRWSSVITLRQIILCVINLMKNIDLHNIIDNDIAQVYKNDKIKFEAIARKWTIEYAN